MQPSSPLAGLYERFLACGQKVSTDTRKLESGSIFFALKGPSFNGNAFAKQALDNGCAAVVIDEGQPNDDHRYFKVEDVLTTLQQLAAHHRKQLSIPFIGITGSNGKTTTKELVTAVLEKKYKVLATVGNLNNHIGVPLTILSVTTEHQIAVIEMGANHQGEIAALCEIAAPDAGLVTNIGKAHLEGFGGPEGVKKGKGELYRYLEAHDGKTFVNGDDDVLMELTAANDKYTYGCKKLFDVIGKDLGGSEAVAFKFTTRYGEKDWSKVMPVRTHILGRYNFANCLAAAAVGLYYMVDEASIRSALEAYEPRMNRSQKMDTGRNIVILDAYNANPNSMLAALTNFAGYPAQSKMLLLGDMLELGEYSASEHQRVIDELRTLGFKDVALVGEQFNAAEAGDYLKFRNTDECRDYLGKRFLSGYTVLIKGSRGMKMETLSEVL